MECTFENCGYYTDGECNICGMGTSGEDTFCRYCKDNSNCYYKQLKRLQQDYVNLSKSFEHLQSSYQKNQEYVLQLKAENERLKAEIKEYKKHSKCAWKCFEGTLCEEGEKYKTCLQEIKGVVTALYMNNWLQMNETARKSIQLLQDLITKAEEE